MKGEELFTMEHSLSHGQRALWFLQNLTPERGSYNLVQAMRIRGELDVPALRRTFQKLVDRHAALRTTFGVRDGEPVQRIYEHVDVYFCVEDASTWSAARLDERIGQEVFHRFDLENGPLLRLHLFTASPRGDILLVAMHHIVTDLWSLAVLMYELGVVYSAERAGVPAPLKPLRAEYTDYIRWQEEMLASPEGERLRSYWQEQLSGELPELNLLTDRPRPAIQTYRGGARSFRLNADLTQGLESLSAANETALHVTLLAAFQVFLQRYTGQEDILVGYPKAGRKPRVARVVGYFVNPVVMRADLSGDPAFPALLKRACQTVARAFEHDAYPFPLLVEQLQPERELSRPMLFQVMFAWQKTTRLVNNQQLTSFALNEAGGGIDLGEIVLESVAIQQRLVPFELSLLMAEAGDELVGLMEYNADLFDGSTVARMLDQFQTLLAGIVANPDLPISMLPLTTEAERDRLLGEWNHTHVAPKQYESIPQLFEAQVAQSPDATAVVLAGNDPARLTYEALNRRANRLAHRLRRLGVGPEVIVGLFVERSIEAIVGILGILKAGGAYVPLDPANPQERLAFMLADAGVGVVVTQADLVERLPRPEGMGTGGGGQSPYSLLLLDADWPTVAREPDSNPIYETVPDNLAYVIYTSGSTGRPKGVLISNRAIANHCRDIRKHFELRTSDRVLQFASYVFDQSVEQILATLITGATLVLRGPEVWPTGAAGTAPRAGAAPMDFSSVVSDFGLTVVNLPPAYWHQWVQDWPRQDGAEAKGIPEDQLRLVISGGDVMPAASLRLWQETPMGCARLLNAYGPTETTVTALTFEIPAGFDGPRIPIGRPPANRTVYILDKRGNPVPVGVPGELYLGGAGLARGYLNRPALTAERFVPDPFDRAGARLYRTGDLARYLPDGNVEFLGRVDQQVKIRGFRIELGEIETVLGRHPEVREVAVVVRGDDQGDKRLVAYVVPGQSDKDTGERDTRDEETRGLGRHRNGPLKEMGRELRGFLKGKLPAYMVPSAFVTLDALPVTSSGKVDRRALPAPERARPDFEGSYVAPRDPIEEELAATWATVLGIERVGIHDNFFELGGHSLMATQLTTRLRDSFGVGLPLREIFEAPTVAELAVSIAQRLAEPEDDEEVADLVAELEQLSEAEVEALLLQEMEGRVGASP